MAGYTQKRPGACYLQADCLLKFLLETQREKAPRLWLNCITSSVLRYLLLFVFFGILSGNAEAVDLNFQTKIKPSPCTVTLNGGSSGGGNWDFGSLKSDALVYPATSAPKVFTLALTECGVDAETASLFTPRITVSAGSETSTPDSAWVFRSSKSTSTGFGFFFNFNSLVAKWPASGVPAEAVNVNSADCTQITTKPNACKAALPANWWKTPVNIAVAVTSPKGAQLQAGSLTASLTFTFDYP